MKYEEFSHDILCSGMKRKCKVAQDILYQKREMLHTKSRSFLLIVRE